MVGEEKVEKVPNTTSEASTSDIPTGIPAEAPARGVPKDFVCEVCNKPFDTKKALSGHMSVHSKKSIKIGKLT